MTVLKPAATFPDLKHLEGAQRHQCRARLSPAARRCRGGIRRRRPCLRAYLPHAAGDAHAARAFRLRGGARRRPHHPPHRVAESVLRADRDRAPSGLAREPRAHQGALSRRRLRRQALHQARGAGDGAGALGSSAGEDLADHGRAILHGHAASLHLHASRAPSRRTGASRRGAARYGGTAALMPISGRG